MELTHQLQNTTKGLFPGLLGIIFTAAGARTVLGPGPSGGVAGSGPAPLPLGGGVGGGCGIANGRRGASEVSNEPM